MKRMRFQTKLMLTVLLAVVLVTGMVISQTEKKVRATYSRLAEEQFEDQAERFLDIRKSRLEAVATSVERLAAAPRVRDAFERADFSPATLETIELLGRSRTVGQLPPRRAAEIEGDGDENADAEKKDVAAKRRSGNANAGGDERKGATTATAQRMIFLVELDGTVHSVNGGDAEVSNIANTRLRGLSVAEDLRSRQVGYLVIEDQAAAVEGENSESAAVADTQTKAAPEVEPGLFELIVAPVTGDAVVANESSASGNDDDGVGELLGVVVVGQLVSLAGNERRSVPVQGGRQRLETKSPSPSQAPPPPPPPPPANGMADRASEAAPVNSILGGGRRRLYAGVLADGVLFRGTVPEEIAGEVEALLREQLTAKSSSSEVEIDHELAIEVEGDGDRKGKAGAARERSHFQIFCDRLNPGGVLPPAYQVIAIPMSQLHADLRDLRLRGSGIGFGAAFFGLLLAWVFSHRLARPIRELANATEEVRQGNLHVRVPVRTQDELGKLAESFNEMAGELEVKEQIRDLLGKVSDEAVAQALISGRLELGGETREVSILFCDIRGFSAMTETMNPGDVIALLNEHMTAMTEVVYAHHGVIDKFVGDEIMVIFGAPKAYGDDSANAARCALKMVECRQRLNADTGRDIDIGIGVATGDVVVGCMGSNDRLNYTVIGERVNRAARLCDEAGSGEVVVDEVTWNEIAGIADGAERLRFKPKGYTASVRAFRLDAIRPGDGATRSDDAVVVAADSPGGDDPA